MIQTLPTATKPLARAKISSGTFFVLPFFVLFIGFGIFSLLFTFFISVFLWDPIQGTGEFYFRGLRFYGFVFTDPAFWLALLRSLLEALPALVLQHAIAIPAAFAIHLVLRRALASLGGLLLVPMLVAPVAVSSGLSFFFLLFSNPLNDLLGLVGLQIPASGLQIFSAIWIGFGWNILLYLMALSSVPRSMLEAAQLDGAGFWRQLGSLAFPLMRPMIFVAVSISIVQRLQANAWRADYSNFESAKLPGFIFGTAFHYTNFSMAAAQTWVFLLVLMLLVGMAYFAFGRNFTGLESPASLESDHAPLNLPRINVILIKLFMVFVVLLSVFPLIALFFQTTQNGSSFELPSSRNFNLDLAAMRDGVGFWRDFLNSLFGSSQNNSGLSLAFGQDLGSNYEALQRDMPMFWRNLWNSLYISSLAAFGAVLTSSLAGFAFAALEFPYKRQLFLVVLIAMVFPALSSAIPHLMQMRLLDWIDTPRTIWLPASYSAIGVFLVRQFCLHAIPKSLIEAARVDGASNQTIYTRIAVPLMTPVLITIAVLTFISTWNQLDVATLMLRSEMTRVIPQVLGFLSNSQGFLLASAISTLPSILILLFFAPQLARGFGLVAERKLFDFKTTILESGSARLLDGADFVRTVACLAVVWSHLGQRLSPENIPKWLLEIKQFLMAGGYGVSAFFVLSGMLLSLPFWKRYYTAQAAPSLLEYAKRRFLRIAPGFYVALIVSFLVARSLEPGEQMWLRLVSGLTFSSAFHYVTFFPTELNGPLWSIGFEVVCYALMPLFMLGLFAIARVRPIWQITHKRTITRGDTQIVTTKTIRKTFQTKAANSSPTLAFAYWIAVLLLTLLAHFWILNHLVPDNDQRGWQYGLIGGAKFWMPNYNPLGWFSHYIIGVLCAGAICLRQQRPRSRTFDYLAIASMVLIAAWVWATRYSPEFAWSLGSQPYAFPIFPSLIGLLLFSAAFSVRLPKILDNPFSRYTAKLSFGIYIWHYLILELVRLLHNSDFRYGGIQDPWHWAAICAFVWLASYSLASLSYTHIESVFLPRSQNLNLQPAAPEHRAIPK